MDPLADLNNVKRRKLLQLPEIELHPSAVKPVASHHDVGTEYRGQEFVTLLDLTSMAHPVLGHLVH
jgi:hypothetical protein